MEGTIQPGVPRCGVVSVVPPGARPGTHHYLTAPTLLAGDLSTRLEHPSTAAVLESDPTAVISVSEAAFELRRAADEERSYGTAAYRVTLARTRDEVPLFMHKFAFHIHGTDAHTVAAARAQLLSASAAHVVGNSCEGRATIGLGVALSTLFAETAGVLGTASWYSPFQPYYHGTYDQPRPWAALGPQVLQDASEEAGLACFDGLPVVARVPCVVNFTHMIYGVFTFPYLPHHIILYDVLPELRDVLATGAVRITLRPYVVRAAVLLSLPRHMLQYPHMSVCCLDRRRRRSVGHASADDEQAVVFSLDDVLYSALIWVEIASAVPTRDDGDGSAVAVVGLRVEGQVTGESVIISRDASQLWPVPLSDHDSTGHHGVFMTVGDTTPSTCNAARLFQDVFLDRVSYRFARWSRATLTVLLSCPSKCCSVRAMSLNHCLGRVTCDGMPYPLWL